MMCSSRLCSRRTLSDASLRCIYWSRYRDGFKTFAEQAEVPGGPLAGCVFASPAETTAWYKHPKMLPKRVSIPFDDIVALHWTTSSDPPITQLQLQVCACPALYRENPATVAVFNAPKTRSFLPHDDVAGGQANVCSVHTVAVSGGAGAKALRVALESKLFMYWPPSWCLPSATSSPTHHFTTQHGAPSPLPWRWGGCAPRPADPRCAASTPWQCS